MSRNVVRPDDLSDGAAWTFVHSNGERTEYRYHSQMAPGSSSNGKGPGNSPVHKLLNPKTGKFAMVTEKWMREGPITSGVSATGFGSHWLVGELVAA